MQTRSPTGYVGSLSESSKDERPPGIATLAQARHQNEPRRGSIRMMVRRSASCRGASRRPTYPKRGMNRTCSLSICLAQTVLRSASTSLEISGSSDFWRESIPISGGSLYGDPNQTSCDAWCHIGTFCSRHCGSGPVCASAPGDTKNFPSQVSSAAQEKLSVSYWHVWTDEKEVSHRNRCDLSAFKLQSISRVAAPSWIDKQSASGAIVSIQRRRLR
jgi:hypothetical protein